MKKEIGVFKTLAAAMITAVLLFAASAFGQEQFQFEVTVAEGGETFRIPLNGQLNNTTNKTYNWNIDWGDGGAIAPESGTQNTSGISHAYTTAGTYTITITPADSEDAWLGAFGFYTGTTANTADAQANRNMVTKVISPLTQLMTRTQTQIDNGTAPTYEWAYTFYGCTNLTMGDNFTFSGGWDTITTVGTYFAAYMFSNCYGASFTMSNVFNLPQGITTVGTYFAAHMFNGCSGTGFMVNGVFKFPILQQTEVNKSYIFYCTFYNTSIISTPNQTRTATSIINGNPAPSSGRETFANNNRFLDRPHIPTNWGGSATPVVISFNSNGGSAVGSYNNATIDFTIQAPTAPTRTHYEFAGWYKNAGLTNAWDFAVDVIVRSTTLYAKWTPAPYTITYELNGGTNNASNPETYTIESSVITLHDPSRTDCSFEGWYSNVSFTGTRITSIPIGSTGNKTYYAKWECSVIFDLNGGEGIVPASIIVMLDTLSVKQKPPTSGFTRYGYVHDGKWYIRTGTSEADYVYTEFIFGTGGTQVTGDVTLYLKWTLTNEMFQFKVAIKTTNGTFSIPLNGQLNNTTNKAYNWYIDWGDGGAIVISSGTQNTSGILHKYAEAGEYTITIRPVGSADAWFGAFGFNNGNSGANGIANKEMVIGVISPLTPLMTRTQAQIDGGTAPTYEWAYTFYGCVNLKTMDDQFTFSTDWNYITTVGNYFAAYMFYDCYGASFTMGKAFNLPSGITTVGIYFAAYMFSNCYGANFTMNEVFNLPSGITEMGTYFAAYMFSGCYGANFTMNEVFNLPSGITSAADYFAYHMFSGCYGAKFTMGKAFNLPSGITTVGDNFAVSMFSNCYGTFFTMNDVFNLPSGITSAANHFADSTFYNCYGENFTMNEVFNLPSEITVVRDYFAYYMFSGCYGAKFTMNDVFNLPDGITVVSNYFAAYMFSNCYGVNFTMNDVFNLPSGITSAADYFAYYMFSGCYGANFTMNEVFNLPSGFEQVYHYFAAYMFSDCYGASFTMNDVFNLPSGITEVGTHFAAYMFSGCYGTSFTMNEIFNLPSGIIYLSHNRSNQAGWFAINMFSDCSGDKFMVNDVFKFPLLQPNELNKTNVFYQTFYNSSSSSISTSKQIRTATSIINSNPIPNSKRQTFTNNSRFLDLPHISENWGGSGNPVTVTFQSNGGSAVEAYNNVTIGAIIKAPEIPTKAGYTFVGWYKEAALTNAWNFAVDRIATSTTLYAKWTAYTVSFDLNDSGTGTPPNSIANVPHDSTISIDLKPETSGFNLIGYTNDGKWHTRTGTKEEDYVYTPFIFGEGGTKVTSDVTLYLKWTINTYTVTFIDHDSTELSLQTVEHGNAATAPILSTREGYTFVCWDTDFSAVTGNLTIMAVYETTSSILSQIATNSLITQIRNGINLTAKTNTTIELYNLNGKLVSRQNYIAGSHSISFGHLPKGMYIVKVSFGSGKQVLKVPVR